MDPRTTCALKNYTNLKIEQKVNLLCFRFWLDKSVDIYVVNPLVVSDNQIYERCAQKVKKMQKKL